MRAMNKDCSVNGYAVLVGISHSEGTGEKVNGDNAVRLMKSILRDNGWQSKNIKMLTNRKATEANVLEAIAWLKSVETLESTVVFMIAAHGSYMSVRLWGSSFKHSVIRDELSGLKSKRQLVIINSCQSGGALVEGKDGVTLARPDRIVLSSCGEGSVDPVTQHLTRWAEVFLRLGLKEGQAGDRASIQRVYDWTVHEYSGGYWPVSGLMADGYGEPFYLDE
jgi:hypothetical protein